MNGILAQTAALAAHAKVYSLDPRLGGDDAYWAAHSTFKYVKSVAFLAMKRGFFRASQKEIATTPASWMATLPRDSAVSLYFLEAAGSLAHVASAFAGATGEGIGVVAGASCAVWFPVWDVPGDDETEPKAWRVQYTEMKTPRFSMPAEAVGVARERLGKVLLEVTDFAAADSELSYWSETFRKAVGALGSASPVAPYHPDILPPGGYTLEARQLLAAAVGGYVFGGMGSWNDGGPASSTARQEYERLSRELYTAVMVGIRVAVNDGMAG